MMASDLGERFWSKVDKNGPIPAHRPDLGPCWVWTAALNRSGYGMFWMGGQMVLAYHLPLGPIESGLERDHLCRVRACVRPGHLEPVTHKVNMARGTFGMRTHCPWGHEYTPENTHVVKGTGDRQCLICASVRAYLYRFRHTDPSRQKDNVMSKWDYEVSKRILARDPSYEALIMAAMRRADTANLVLLREAFPDTWAELDARYNAPGGTLPGDPEHGEGVEARQRRETVLADVWAARSRATEHPH